MDKLKLHCPKGNSPTCISCGNWNAMLGYNARVYVGEEKYIRMLICRDCGFAVTEESVELIEPVEELDDSKVYFRDMVSGDDLNCS